MLGHCQNLNPTQLCVRLGLLSEADRTRIEDQHLAEKSANGAGDKRSLMGKSLPPLTIVVLLSLGTWSYFYMKQMALTPAETSVIVGFWLLVVFAARWIFGRLT